MPTNGGVGTVDTCTTLTYKQKVKKIATGSVFCAQQAQILKCYLISITLIGFKITKKDYKAVFFFKLMKPRLTERNNVESLLANIKIFLS